MKLATTTEDFKRYCNSDYSVCIQHLYDTGFRHIDLSMYEVRSEDALIIREDWREYAGKLKI